MSPVRTIWEVRQRTWDRSSDRVLGFFVDDMMADNAIQACYRQAWQTVMGKDFNPSVWFPREAKEIFRQQGWDVWWVDDHNSDSPLFVKTPFQLWDQLPSSIQNFTFTLEDAVSPMVRVQV